jgi:hypothetical protein
MSYARMQEAEPRLEQEVAALLAQAQQVDATEDAQYGPGRRGDELPVELARRESRLAKIRAAKMALEQEAREQATRAAEAARAKLEARQHREGKAKGRPPTVPDPAQARPTPTAQRNFTDPDSRSMKDGATKSFEQAYNAQAAVDSHAQIIVAAAVTQEAGDVQQCVPMLEQVQANLAQWPGIVTADAGYFSEANLTAPELAAIDLYVPPDRQKHGQCPAAGPAPPPPVGTVCERMRHKITTSEGHAVYARRKAIVEPVFGQIKEARGFRRFSFRGLPKVAAEWSLICLTHNLLKLFHAGWCPQPA